jgi:hypothetical protein
MSKWKSNYIITTLSSSVDQYTSRITGLPTKAPYWFGPHSANASTLRGTCEPYILRDGERVRNPVCPAITPPPDDSQEIAMNHIASTSQLYVPNLDSDQSIAMSHIAATSQAYTPEIVPDQSIAMSHIAATSQAYTPEIVYDQSIAMSHIAATSQAYTPEIVYDQSIAMSHIAATSQLYAPTVTTSDTVYYTQIVSASNPDGTTPKHVGSLWLEEQTYANIKVILGEGGHYDAFAQFRRFTNGTLLTQIKAEMPGQWASAGVADITVSTADWYDIYISGSDSAATSSIRGVYYDV